MKQNKLTVIKYKKNNTVQSNASTITFSELEQWVKSGVYLKNIFRYKEVNLLVYRLNLLSKPFTTVVAIWLLAWWRAVLYDNNNNKKVINIRYLITRFFLMLKDGLSIHTVLKNAQTEIVTLQENERKSSTSLKDQHNAFPVYLRTDLYFGMQSGGSVGHISGVLNSLDNFFTKPLFLTTDIIPTVRDDIEKKIIMPIEKYWDYKEIPALNFNTTFYKNAISFIDKKGFPLFIYQRYSINNYSGLKLANHYSVPFVLEYNGSEVWINKNWGTPLKYEALSLDIEITNLKSADLVVVVSSPMRDELVERGVAESRILVNPNGVNEDVYSPEIDGSEVRSTYKIKDTEVVIGFIGTFGNWHGAEVLAEAFGQLLQQYPEYRDAVKLLMIGDGVTLHQVKENLEKYNVDENCILTGLIPQEEGPSHLAACDVLASPHVPNPDGTPFFGSPTKLFEYMAMGKGIVASNLDQIGEVLQHNKTAFMVKPGDSLALMKGLKTLIDNPALRDQLGQAARKEVLCRYTWEKHTRKIIENLKERCT